MYSQKYIETHTRWLRRDLNALEGWYDALEDAAGQKVGSVFREAFRSAAAGECVAPAEELTGAVYKPFDMYEGFVNQVIYGAQARRSAQRLFLARNHEAVHALQFGKAPALHADLFNRHASVIICPRDYLRMRLLAEKDAHSKELLLSSLAAKKGLLPEPEGGVSLMPVSEFDDICSRAENLGAGLKDAAEAIMDKDVLVRTAAGTGKMKCRDIYNSRALVDYANGLAARRSDLANGSLVFARLEADDLRMVGESFGPNLYDYGGDSGKLEDADIDLHSRIVLDQIHGWLGIADEADLPGFGAALAAKGSDPAAFLTLSRAGGAKADGVKPPKPLAYR